MKRNLFLLLTLLLIAAQDSPQPAITFPAPGDVLQGEVTIRGTTDIPGFLSSQLDFAYASDPTATWFSLQTSTQPTVDSTLAVWDTALITDGEYILRLRVNLTDGTFTEATVSVRVQNDAPLPSPTLTATSTPAEIMAQVPTPFLIVPSPTSTPTQRPTPTLLPTNPASLNQTAIYTSLGRGALAAIAFFVFAAILLRLRRE
ncbi:MAG TPA: hypothetical protein VNK49_12640 [Anaerolineales bacterium]|nr:hypothetical protein [Anaerolineales bacterium]